MKKLLTCFLALLVLAAFSSFASGTNEGKAPVTGELTKIRMGIIPFQDFYPFEFAKQKGWFAEVGIDAEFLDFQFFPDATEALAAGAIDLAPQEVAALMPVVNKFPNLRLIIPVHVFDNGFAIMIRPDGPFKTYDDLLLQYNGDVKKAEYETARQLQGKTVVTTGNTDMELGVYAASVKVGGLDWKKDIKIIDMDPNQGLAAFLSGTGDAYIGGIPQRLGALKQGMKELITGSHLGPGSVPLVGYATTQEFIDKHYDALLRVLYVWNRTNRYIAENPAQTEEGGFFITQKLNEKTGAHMAPSDFKSMFNNWQHFPPTVAAWQWWYQRIPPKQRWGLASEFFVTVKGTVKQTPDFSTFILFDKFLNDYKAKFGQDK